MAGIATVLFGFGSDFLMAPLMYHLLINGQNPSEPG
jgi:uncharacterized membrane protein YfcA